MGIREEKKKEEARWGYSTYLIYAEVSGERYGESGLAYHCEYNICVEGLSGGKEWVVDHLASGTRIAAFNSQARARFFIKQIAPLANWHVSADILNEQCDALWKLVMEAYTLATNWKPEQANKLLTLRRQVSLREALGKEGKEP